MANEDRSSSATGVRESHAAPSQRRRALKIMDVGSDKQAGAYIAGRLVGAGYLTKAEVVRIHGADTGIDVGMRNPLWLDEDLPERIVSVLRAYDSGQGAPANGTAKHTRRKVLRAILWNMEIEGSATVPAAVRSIAEDANVNWKTVDKHIRGLIDDGLLVEAKPAKGTRARYVRLGEGFTTGTEENGSFYLCTKGGPSGAVNGFSDTMLEAWSHKELGETGRRIYEALPDMSAESKTIRAIVDASGVSRSTVKRKLAKMAELGFAQRTADGWTRGTESPESLPNSGFKHRQRRHAIDREQWSALPSPEKPCKCASCTGHPTAHELNSLKDMRPSPAQRMAIAKRQLTQRLKQEGWSDRGVAANFGELGPLVLVAESDSSWVTPSGDVADDKARAA